MEESTFMDGVRGVFAVIDRGVYGLITTFYNMIESLTNFTIISGDKISEISGKIYALIALFMIFKISFSLINYLVNPDMLSDKAKGGGTLIKNIILTFALVVIVPFGFNILYQAQAAILSDNLIGKFVYGDESVDGEMVFSMDEDECGGITASTSNAGDYIGLMAFRPFFQLSEEKDSSDFTSDLQKMYCSASVNGKDASVKNLLANNKVYSAPHVFSTNHFYVVDYTIFISTAVGIVLVLVFLSFCFDIATRTIKLQFLELLAPIPIISYIDPDQSKNGMFSKWLKEVFNTWLSLFMRLLAFHIAIYLISVLKDVQLEGESLWINLLIIIGVLMFAKELPKLLESIMGIKMSGSFNLNPLKKLDEQALGFKTGRRLLGKGMTAGAALGMAGVGSVLAHNAAKKKFNEDRAKMEDKVKDNIRQKIEEARLNDLRNARNNAEYEYANRKYNARMNELNKGNYSKLDKNEAQKIAAIEDAYNKKFSNAHPFASAVAAELRAANAGFKSNPKNIADIIKNASSVAKQAAKERTYTDNYNMIDRLKDVVTDWGDIKSNGTASIVDSNIKKLNDQLTMVTNALDSLRQEQGSFAPGTFIYDNAGNPSVRAGSQNSIEAQANLDMQKELAAAMKDLNSEIKNQTKILEQQKKSGK